MKLLHVDSSISGKSSASRKLSAAVVAAFRLATPDVEVLRRDLDAGAIPHLDSRLLPAIRPADFSTGGVGVLEDRDKSVLDEFLAADIVVIGAPMYNFTIPSQLKAWIDRIVIAGKTFRYTESGPRGLAGGKRVIIASARGGLYAPGMPYAANDFQEPYLGAIFAFMGIPHVTILRAEGLALEPQQRETAMQAALASITPMVTGFVMRNAA